MQAPKTEMPKQPQSPVVSKIVDIFRIAGAKEDSLKELSKVFEEAFRVKK